MSRKKRKIIKLFSLMFSILFLGFLVCFVFLTKKEEESKKSQPILTKMQTKNENEKQEFTEEIIVSKQPSVDADRNVTKKEEKPFLDDNAIMETEDFFRLLVEEARRYDEAMMVDALIFSGQQAKKEVYSKETKIETQRKLPKELYLEQTDFQNACRNQKLMDSSLCEKLSKHLTKQQAAAVLKAFADFFEIYGDKEKEENAQKYKRISDMEQADKDFFEAIYFCFANGIMSGESDGAYSHTRSFLPQDSLMVLEGKNYIRRLFWEEERALMSPDAQLIRTTDLPEQAKLFPYILASFPNVYYDYNQNYMRYLNFEEGPIEKTKVEESGFLKTWCTPSTIEAFREKKPRICAYFPSQTDLFYKEETSLWELKNRYQDRWEEAAINYLSLALNFDYRTIREDKKWQEEIKNQLAFYTPGAECVGQGSFMGQRGIDQWFEHFLDSVEENHTVVECSDIDFDFSTLYYWEDELMTRDYAPLFLRVHFRYRITTDLLPGYYQFAEVLPSHWAFAMQSFDSFGEWKDVYAELAFGVNFRDRTGVAYLQFLEGREEEEPVNHFDPSLYLE